MYDVIVIGTGGIGSSALYELSRRGVRALGIDQFPPGHDRGSSHGESRVIRRSYFEHVDYVPLLNLSYRLWDEFGDATGESFFQRCGIVYVGADDNEIIQGVLASAAAYQLDVQRMNHQEAAVRFPGFAIPAGATVVWEPDAGYLQLEPSIRAMISLAKQLGVESRHGIEVVGWQATNQRVVVETTGGRFEAKNLIVTAGCWARSLLADLNIPLRVLRKHLHWFRTNDGRYHQSQGCPCFFVAQNDNYIYGFPDYGAGLKVAVHSGGTGVDDPLTDDRLPEPSDDQQIESFLAKYMPGVSSTRLRHEVCFYTMTPDGHFVIDRHPQYDNVVFAAGLSGHGYKFAPALGRVLTELALDGRCEVDIEFLSVERSALQT